MVLHCETYVDWGDKMDTYITHKKFPSDFIMDRVGLKGTPVAPFLQLVMTLLEAFRFDFFGMQKCPVV